MGWLMRVDAAGALELWVTCLRSALDSLQIRGLIAVLRVFVLFRPLSCRHGSWSSTLGSA